ncbi:MAG: reverse gyrase, partial [Staphylothermus sp.]|nr:reverse gyrase [Staphylothermus sp.]
TVSEFMKALDNKRSIDLKLVEAEIYRRVMDRLIGFSLSQELWRVYGKKWYGAGRVQTPVLGWIINSYNEYLANKCRKIIIKTNRVPLKISVCIDHKDKDLYKKLKSLKRIILKKKRMFIDEVKPAPPYTTDELLFDASRIGIPSALTMKIAQELFESGLITYHRTDSHYVSSTGISIASKYVEEKGLSKLFRPSHWGSKGAHEAIRPVHPLDREDLEKAIVEGLISPVIPLTWLHFRVYDLIFRRFIASQMKPYKVLKAEFLVKLAEGLEHNIVLDVDIVEEGFNVVKPIRTYPELKNIDEVELEVSGVKSLIASKKPLYNEGSIIKKMREEGLGRPSTYSKIISSIVRHGYIIRSKKKGYLIPTKSGIQVYDYLFKNYPLLVSVETTKKMEQVIDLIAYGKVGAVGKIVEFYELIKNYKLPLTIKEVEAYVNT